MSVKTKTRIGRASLGVLVMASSLSAACTGSVERNTPSARQSPGTVGPAGGGGTSTTSDDCTPLDAVPRRIWRLSVDQFGNAVRDLLGLAQPPALNNNGGTAEYAFFSDDSAVVDAQLQFSIYQATKSILTQIAPRIPALAACTSGEQPQACAQRFAQSFGEKAFRRPLDADEVTALMQVYSAEGANTDFNTGIGLMIQATLLSPSFLHRTELGPTTLAANATGTTTLNPYEVATQLSFLFTNSTPDSPLLTAAADGTLATSDGLETQIDRLLKLDAVKQNISSITLDWFNVRQLFSKAKDPSFFMGLPTADRDPSLLESDLLTSTQRFIDDVLWNGSGKISDLVLSQRVFVNQRLATLYGYQFTGQSPDQFVSVEDNRRAGMLTQPAFIWSMSDPGVTSIVKRGKFIHDDVVCQDPVPSPGNLLNDPAIQAKLAMLPTELDKSHYRMSTQPCVGCHAQMDPYALVLQNFDPIGGYRTVADGVAVDPTGAFSAPSPVAPATLTGPAQFAQALVSKSLLSNCAVQKISSYIIGRMIRDSSTCEVEAIQKSFAQTDGTMTSLFRAVALAQFTRQRAGGTP